MIFDSNKEADEAILKLWRYYGKCRDEKGRIWNWWTNSKSQYCDFKKKGEKFGMKLISDNINKNYKVIRKLLR